MNSEKILSWKWNKRTDIFSLPYFQVNFRGNMIMSTDLYTEKIFIFFDWNILV